jgi:acyl-CoA thioester hydrolase
MTEFKIENYRHKLELKTRFMDIDAFGHVNNARYLNFLEEARIAYSQEALGLFKKVDDFNVLVARIEIDFKKPILFGEKISIFTRISKIGTKSFSFESTITTNKNETIIVAAHAIQTIVTVDKSTGRSIPISDSVVTAIKDYEKNES